MASIAILGYGDQGRSAFEYWNKPENTITICDQHILDNTPPGAKTNFGGDYLMDLERFDMLIRSPGLHPRDIMASNPDHPEVMNRITTVTNEFFKVCPSKNTIGITGTKGKGTTSTLITKFLEAAGHRVHLGGNIGTPPLDLLKGGIKSDDWVVLELANFQLIDLQYSPKIAVCLMVVPEHLDWHTDMYEYVTAKQQMFDQQTPDDIAVYNARNLYSEEIVNASRATKIAYDVPPVDMEPLDTRGVYVEDEHVKAFGEKICRVSDVALLGRHNLENVCAAISATWQLIGKDKKIIKKVLRNFPGLPHRLEIIKQIKGVWYVNDSFGTTPETAVVALETFPQPKVLIVGGSDKGARYEELANSITKNNVKHIIAIGQTGPKVVDLVKQNNPQSPIPATVLTPDVGMAGVVETAQKYVHKGDVVLLSTGSASFGMFANYKDRGEQFRAAVLALSPAEK